MTAINSLQQLMGGEVPDKNKHGIFLNAFAASSPAGAMRRKLR